MPAGGGKITRTSVPSQICTRQDWNQPPPRSSLPDPPAWPICLRVFKLSMVGLQFSYIEYVAICGELRATCVNIERLLS